jgi:uncharacterized protein (TIGR04255 family)
MTHPDVPPPELPHFVLDMDCFDVRRFESIDPKQLRSQLNDFHADIHRLFRWSLTEEGAARFGLGEDSSSVSASATVGAGS